VVKLAVAQHGAVVENAEAFIRQARRRTRRRRRFIAAVAVVALVAGIAIDLKSGGSSVSLRGPTRSSPDGPIVDSAAFWDEGTLAFVSQTTLYVLDGSNGEVDKVTAPGIPSDPVISTDGRWLAFKESGPKVGGAGLTTRYGWRTERVTIRSR
jgi:Tol biopolymer transport system component